MKKLIILGFLGICCALKTTSQVRILIKGKVVESISEKPLSGVSVSVFGTPFFEETNFKGIFKIENIPIGSYEIQIRLKGYTPQKIPITLIENESVDLGTIFLSQKIPEIQEANTITLTDEDLLDDGNRSSDYIAGLFQASKDAYLKAAAYNFSQAWFKVRGYDSSYGTILINGVEMNKLFDGRPQWSNWGGLNDVFKNQEFSSGIRPSESAFGGISGTTNFSTRASEYWKGLKVSFSSTNKSYTGRVMATYATGLNKKGWGLVVSGSRRIANEGFLEGTSYNSWAAFLAAEKKINDHHSFNLTAFISSNKKGKSSPNTQEVYDLKGFRYNVYWGLQEGNKRNSRMKVIFEPIVMLSHYYERENTKIVTTLGYQFGHIGNSRLGYFNAPNPDPAYWKYLPSNFLRFQDNPAYENAYLAEQEFLNNGQINWEDLYLKNIDFGNSLYYLYEDRVDDTQFLGSSILNTNLSDNLNLNTGLFFKNLTSENYGHMLDLLGGSGFVDLDQFATGNAQQNNLNDPNRVVVEEDKFQYNYRISAAVASAFAQLQFTGNKINYFVGLNVKTSSFQREGLFKNGTFEMNSFGKGEKQSFTDVSTKGGFTYKFTGRHLFNLNGAFVSKAPTIRTTFSNSRVNNNITPDLASEKIMTADANYIFRSLKTQTRLTTFYTKFSDGIETSFFFAEGLRGDQADFVNEIITGVTKKHIGAELSFEYQLTPSVSIIAAGSFGEFTYDNNPQLYVQSESFVDENSDFGTTYLKNYRISGTPQRAYSVGFEYRDPKYWWFQTNANYLTNNYVDISPLLRTNNFFLDADSVPFVDDETGDEVTQDQVNELLTQEKFDDAFLVNIVGGKSWKFNNSYFGFFAGINNVLGEIFKSGGFEQARNANYPELKQDKQLNKPIFGSKYWYGNKTSYYLNLYIRF